MSVNEATPILKPQVVLRNDYTNIYSQEFRGYICLASSAVCHSTMTTLVHVAAIMFHFSTTSSVMVRAVVSTIMASIYILSIDYTTYLASLSYQDVLTLVARGIVGGMSAYFQFTALGTIPVGDAVTLFFLYPVIVLLMSAVFLGERLTYFNACACVTSFIGVLFVSHPSFLPFGGEAQLHPTLDPSKRLFGVGMALIASLCAASCSIIVRGLGARIHYMLHVFAYGLGCFFCALLSMLITRRSTFSQIFTNVNGSMINVLSAILGFGSQALLDRGLQQCAAGPGSVIRSLSVPFSFLLGLLFLSERPSAIGFLGMIIIFISVGGIGWRELSQRTPSKETSECNCDEL